MKSRGLTVHVFTCIFWLVIISQSLLAQDPITSIATTNVAGTNTQYDQDAPSDAGNDLTANATYTIRNGRGNNVEVVSYTVNSNTFNNILEPDTLAIRRTDGSRFVNIWYTLITDPFGNFTLDLDPDVAQDADLIYRLKSLNAGYDNILVNDDDQATGSIQAQTERVDIIWNKGIVTCAPANAIFPVVERGGNDEIKVAAITSLDANGDPDGYSNMVLIEDPDWPQTGVTFDNYLVLRRQTLGQDPLPLLNIGTFVPQAAQTVQGVAVSFTDLGIAANQIVYGYSLFASDVDDAIHDLTDITTFPTTTLASVSGIDLVAGVTAAVSSDNCLTPATGPGGYKVALATWLKANETDDVTTSTENATVTDWQDHWVGDHDFTTGTAAPTYRSTSTPINFNPTVDFTTSATSLTTPNNTDFNTGGPYTRKSINIAFRTDVDVTTRQALFEQGAGARGLNIYIANGSVQVSAWNRNNDGAGSPWNNTGNIQTVSSTVVADTEYIVTLELDGNNTSTGQLRAYLNGQSIGTLSNVGLLYNHGGGIELGASDGSRYEDGTTGGTFSFDGEISEFIYCNEPGALPIVQRNRIESYLALKYGITLDQSTPINYVNSEGQIIFNTTNNASIGGYLEYNNDIAGIGRDDGSEFEQPQSRSENVNSVVTVNNGGTFNNDDTWFIWGNDGGADTDTETSDVPALITQRVERVWRVAEKGQTGNNSITFDLDELNITGTPTASDYSLLVGGNSSNGDFTGASVISGGVLDAVNNTITFNNVNLENGQYFTLGTGFINCAPGNVSTNLALWLRADLGPNATSGEVTEWQDQAGSNNAAGTVGTVPTYSGNSINFNPGLDFDGVDNVLTSGAGFHSNNFFLVINPDDNLTSASGSQAPLGYDVSSANPTSDLGGFFLGGLYGTIDDVLGTMVGNGATSYTLIEDDNTKTISSSVSLLFEVRENAGATAANIFQNGQQLPTSGFGSYLSVSDEDYSLGRFRTPNDFTLTRFFDGQIAEIISYSARPSAAETARIQSYLAIKYGISIDQTTGQDYVNSSGTAVWNSTTNSGYADDIAGIGRDDDSCLEQKQSSSSNAGSLVTIGNGTIATDNNSNPNAFTANNSFLIWGNDGASANAANVNTVDVPPSSTVTERMARVWKVQETGTVGNTTVSFDLAGLGYDLTNANRYQLMVSPNATIANATTIVGGTLNGTVLTFENIDFDNGDFFTLGTDRDLCGPGGVTTNLALWLRADEGTNTTVDNTDLATWADQSGLALPRNGAESNLGGQTPVEPTLQTNEINFNPVIEFINPNSTNASFIETINGNNVSGDMTLIAVFESGQGGGSTTAFEDAPAIIGAGAGASTADYGLGLSQGNVFFNASSNSDLNLVSPLTYNDLNPYLVTATRVQSIAAGSLQMYVNSENVVSGASTNTVLSAPTGFGIGNHANNSSVAAQFNGKIAEAIVFSNDLSATERQRVESYLAIKYGLTRNASVGNQDYLASDGTTSVWTWSEQPTYNNDIAGLARDDNGCFLQEKSKSENDDALVTMEIASALNTNDSYMLWGNDNAPIEDRNNREFNSSQVQSRLNREWYVQETGTVGSVELTFDLDDISGPLGVGTNNLNLLRLMVDDDGDFTSGVTLVQPTSVDAVNNTATFTVNFTDGQFYTLGSEEQGALPIELISFTGELLENSDVQLKWVTASETDNSFFDIERSADGKTFESIGQVAGTGTTEAVQHYHFLDQQPVKGYNFYRLKQMDFSGESETSEVISLFVNALKDVNLGLYPNPVRKGDAFNLSYQVAKDTPVELRLMTTTGRVIDVLDETLKQNEQMLSLSSANLPRGLILVKITDAQASYTLKLLVE